MATVDHTFTVDAPPAVVFAYLTDREKATVWQASLLEAQFSPDAPVHKGTEIHEIRKLLGLKIESTVEVTEFEPDRVFAGRVRSGPVPWQFRYTFEGADGSTRVDFHMEGEPGGFFRVAEPLVVRTVEKQLENDFSTLKELVETS
jgi:ligand-binding SRPBCC domain-containing protein